MSTKAILSRPFAQSLRLLSRLLALSLMFAASLCLFAEAASSPPVPGQDSHGDQAIAGDQAPVAAQTPVAVQEEPQAAPESPRPPEQPAAIGFDEVWAYLMDGEEACYDPKLPITDIGYFGAGLNVYGQLAGVPNRSKLPATSARVHLVVAETGNIALTHFCVDPRFPLRDALVADILKAAQAYDGVQIDFEAVGTRDYENFRSFLALLKAGLGEKTLSVALPARVSEKGDLFDYSLVGSIADRVIVMAYDEHWSGSDPGPVASLDWCRRVSAYALAKIPLDRLVMGAPFYGRAWADRSLARAYKYSGFARLVDEKRIEDIQRDEGIPFFEYSETVNVKAYFEDASSARARLAQYRDWAIRKVAFWRLGQEDPGVWQVLSIMPADMRLESLVSRPACPSSLFATPE